MSHISAFGTALREAVNTAHFAPEWPAQQPAVVVADHPAVIPAVVSTNRTAELPANDAAQHSALRTAVRATYCVPNVSTLIAAQFAAFDAAHYSTK